MSLFANTKPATGGGSGLFGNTNANTQSQQQPAASGNTGTQPSTSGGGGLFGNTNTSTAGNTAQASSGTKPAGGGLFANSGTTGGSSGAAAPSGTAGAAGSSSTGGLFGNKPATTGTTTSGQSTGTGQTTTGGLFGGGGTAGATQTSQGSSGGSSLTGGLSLAAKPQPVKTLAPPVYTSTYEKYLKACQSSNQYLFDLISDPRPALSLEDFEKIMKDAVVKDKLTLGLAFYNKGRPGESTIDGMKKGTVTWPGKIPVSDKAQQIIKSVSDKLGLSEGHTFTLFELYFEFNKPLLDRLQRNNPQPPVSGEEIANLQRTIMRQYYKERINLLECIYQVIVLGTAQSSIKYKSVFEKIISENIKGKESYGKELLKTYIGLCDANMNDVAKRLTDLRDREEWALQNLKEEFHILKILSILYYNLQECSPDFFVEMLQRFHKDSFYGSFLKYERQITFREILIQKEEYATMISDICMILLYNALGLKNFEQLLLESDEDRKINKEKNPLNIIIKKGKDIAEVWKKVAASALHSTNSDHIVLAPLIMACRKLGGWYLQHVKDEAVQKTLKDLALEKEEPTDYLTYMLEMKDRELFKNASRLSLYFYRNTLKAWVCVMAQSFEVENIYNYEKLVDICCECLKESENLEKFWSFEFRYRASVAVLLFELLRMFPFREAKVIKLITTLLGNKKHNYVANILRLFKSLNSYSLMSTDLEAGALKTKKHPSHRATYVTENAVEVKGLMIPANTPMRIIFGEEGSTSRIYEFECQYNFWNVLYKRWTNFLAIIKQNKKVAVTTADFKLIKLICKIIVFDNTIVDILEEHFASEGDDSSQSSLPISLLLIETIVAFQKLPEIPQKLVALLYKALASLQAHPIHSATLASVIQLYPRAASVQFANPEASMMRASFRSASRMSSGGYNQGTEWEVHPLLNTFNVMKRLDKSKELSESYFDTYIAILQFAHEIISNNEFLFDLYPNEKYMKLYHGNNMSAINKNIQKGAEILVRAQEQGESADIKLLNRFIKGIKNQSLLYSTFIDDLFAFIYKDILDGYDKMAFVPELMDKKWKIGSYLLRITNVLLQKFSVGLHRALLVSDEAPENYLMMHIVNYFNDSRISELILKTIEVVINPETLRNNRFGEKLNSLGIENRYWMTYIFDQSGSNKQAKKLRQKIANCFECLESIVNLIEIYSENRSITESAPSLMHQSYVSKLNLVDTFEKLLAKKELIHSFTHNDMTQSVKINIIIAILSYINFDINKGISPWTPRHPQIEKILENPASLRASIVTEEEVHQIGPIIGSVDPNLTKSITVKPQLKTNQKVNAVSTLALRVLTKLVIVWEDQIPQRKPLLYSYITMISHSDDNFASNSLIKSVINELLCVFVNFDTQPEDACALLELMTVCLYSQPNFVDLLLKNTANYNLFQQDSFLKFVENFFKQNVTNFKPLLSKLIIFLSEVFQREARYSSFLKEVRKNRQLVNSLFTSVFKLLAPHSSVAHRIGDYCNLNSQDLKPSAVKEFSFQLEKLICETLVTQECSNMFSTITAIRFLMQELISSSKRSKDEASNIALCLQEFFKGSFSIWLESFKQKSITKFAEGRALQEFKADLTNSNNKLTPDFFNEDLGYTTNRSMNQNLNASYVSTFSRRGAQENVKGFIDIDEFNRYPRKKQLQFQQAMEVEKESSAKEIKNRLDSIVLRGVYKTLDVNLYGYGRDFIYDTQEIAFAMFNLNYKKEFIYRSVLFLNKQNLINSLIALEHKYFESMISLFKFVSTLGLKGQAFSSHFYHFSAIPQDLATSSLEDVFEDPKEKVLANANVKTVFPFGFIEFFTEAKATDALDKRVTQASLFLEEIIKTVWNSIKKDSKHFEVSLPNLKALEQKATLLSSAFNLVFYLLKVSKNLLNVASDNKGAKPDAMETEKEKKKPLILQVTNLIEVLQQIYEDFNRFVWARVSESTNLLEISVDISPYVVLEMTFLLCLREISDFVKINSKEIKEYMGVLELCLQEREKVPCFSLILTCFELLFTISPDAFLNYLTNSPNQMLKFLIIHLGSDQANEVESIFLVRLFAELAKDLNGALLLKENNIIWELCLNKKLKEAHQINEYDNGRRNPYQVMWCWTLILVRQLIDTLDQESGFMNTALGFLKEYSGRINYILSLPSQFLSKDPSDFKQLGGVSEPSINPGQPSNYKKFSIAYFEEFELTATLLTSYFEHREDWATINRSLFETTLYHITHFALKISKPLKFVLETTVAVTPFEKILQQIVAADKKDGPDQVPLQKPSATPGRKSIITEKNAQIDIGYEYSPTVFSYKIECSLLNIISNLLYCAKSGLQHSDLLKLFDIIDLSRTDRKKIGVKYENSYWDDFTITLDETKNFLIGNIEKWSAKSNTVGTIAKKYDYFNNSVISTIQNFSLNTNLQSYTLQDLKDLASTALSLVAFNRALHYSMVKIFKISEPSFLEGNKADNKQDLQQFFDKCQNTLCNDKIYPGGSIECKGNSYVKKLTSKLGISGGEKATNQMKSYFEALKDEVKGGGSN